MGEGRGEGILRMVAIFPNTFAAQYKPCGLLPSLQPSPTGREDGEAVGVKGFVN
ncbi:hypothetical protein T556_00295 [Neisseria gonorrhoeae NG-k51.05]|nr:hypothetical protein T556_00295 [Neisseria gonorrhoeae NG-k51.05]